MRTSPLISKLFPLIFVILSFVLLTQNALAEVLIDDFNGNQAVESLGTSAAQNNKTAVLTDSSAIGGTRSYKASVVAGTGVKSKTENGTYFHSQEALTRGNTLITWDGDSVADNINYSGLHGTPLLMQQDIGETGFRVSIASFTRPANQTVKITITVYDASDPSGNKYSRGTITLSRQYTNEIVVLPFADLNQFGSDGPADLENAGALTALLDGNAAYGANLSITRIDIGCIKDNFICPARTPTRMPTPDTNTFNTQTPTPTRTSTPSRNSTAQQSGSAPVAVSATVNVVGSSSVTAAPTSATTAPSVTVTAAPTRTTTAAPSVTNDNIPQIDDIDPNQFVDEDTVNLTGRNFSTQNTITLEPIFGTDQTTSASSISIQVSSPDGKSLSFKLPKASFVEGRDNIAYNLTVTENNTGNNSLKSLPATIYVAKSQQVVANIASTLAPKSLQPKIAVVYFEFSNEPPISRPDYNAARSTLSSNYYQPISTSKILSDTTYGQFQIKSENIRVVPISVLVGNYNATSRTNDEVDWMLSTANYLDRTEMGANRIRLSNYDQVFFVSLRRHENWNFEGITAPEFESYGSNLLGKSRHPILMNGNPGLLKGSSIYAHEFSHAYFSLHHVGGITACPDGLDFNENLLKCGPYNLSETVMGDAYSVTALAYHRLIMDNGLKAAGGNFFESTRIESINSQNLRTDGIYTISTIDDVSASGKKALRIEGHDSRVFYVEFRRLLGDYDQPTYKVPISENARDMVWVSTPYKGGPFQKDRKGDLNITGFLNGTGSRANIVILKFLKNAGATFNDQVDNVKITLLSHSGNTATIKVEYLCTTVVVNSTASPTKYTPSTATNIVDGANRPWLNFLSQPYDYPTNDDYGLADTSYFTKKPGFSASFEKGWYSVNYLRGATAFRSPLNNAVSYFINTLKTDIPIIGQNLCQRPKILGDSRDRNGDCTPKFDWGFDPYDPSSPGLVPTPNDFYSAQSAIRDYHVTTPSLYFPDPWNWEHSVVIDVDKKGGFTSLAEAQDAALDAPPYMLYVPQNATLLKFTTLVQPQFLSAYLTPSSNGYPTYEICREPSYVPPPIKVYEPLDLRLENKCPASNPFCKNGYWNTHSF